MSFFADKQTLEDINIPGRYRQHSILNLFAKTCTRGGERLMEEMFRAPLTDAAQITARADVFEFFTLGDWPFPIDEKLYETFEHYLARPGGGSLAASFASAFRYKFLQRLYGHKEHQMVVDGIKSASSTLRILHDYVEGLLSDPRSEPYRGRLEQMLELLGSNQMSWLRSLDPAGRLNVAGVARCDHRIRTACNIQLKQIMQFIWEIDVNTAVGQVAAASGFVKAKALPGEGAVVDIEGLYHPRVPGAVANDIRIDGAHNVFFLTGANMAGKSTLMKSVGVAVFMAHMGFPVAARRMEFSVFDGMFSSINLPDNLAMGYSHFYAEVLRVKNVAVAVSRGRRLLVLFDELFKGTNVKDAYDATVAVIEAFASHDRSLFLISTHITEAGDYLRERTPNMRFFYMPTEMEGTFPVYPYVMRPGITADRHGMMIIGNERILETIRGQEPAKNINR